MEIVEYNKLSELEKIPYRVEIATVLALEEIQKGTDLKPILKRCIEKEQYCGAEGIKRALHLIKH